MAITLRRLKLSALLVVVVLAAAACSESGASSSTGEQGQSGSSYESSQSGGGSKPQHGGTVVNLLPAGYTGSWPSGLDPASDTTGGANLTQFQAIFGGLFLLRADTDGSNARIVGNQAASGKLSPDAKTLTIRLKPGIEFSDGSPLNAEAVIWNFKRAFDSKCCAPTWQLRKENPFTSPDPLTVVIHLSQPNAAILHGFPTTSVNWIASPTAFEKIGQEKFKIKPVGAGPFTVVSNKLSSELVLKRNPDYFRENLPYLDKLVFKSIGGDQAGYQALLAGEADAYQGATNSPVIQQAKKSPKLQVTVQPGTRPLVVKMNTQVPPFNDKKAREVLYYASNWPAISKGVRDGSQPVVQSFIAPAGLYYHEKVPGYRTYNPDKAEQLVKELGGLEVQLDFGTNYIYKKVATALQTQWKEVGVDVDIKGYPLSAGIKRLKSGKWQAFVTQAGSWDPAAGLGVAFKFRSTSPYTGVKDPKLDMLLDKAASRADDDFREKMYQKISQYLSDNAYATFGIPNPPANIAVKGVHGPGLTTKIPREAVNTVIWGEVRIAND